MDEELNKYMKDRMDEAVDNLVGQGVDTGQIIWGYIYDLLEKKTDNATNVIMNASIWVL